MAISYKKLWKLLIDKDMKKKICSVWLGSVRHPLQSSERMRM